MSAKARVTGTQPKTIDRELLYKLSFINSKRLPQYIDVEGKRLHWVGIGWIDEEPARGDEIKVIERGSKKKINKK